ncbi:glycosyltransferase family 4 protein [Flavobacterium psychrotrophum]|uniref:glycosyltransferase family 4 protein n=1 Tax=Flavobacterium psychrotrophum TaxID=2294119 RepID=UPI000E322AE0|nr:glycosyltransferase family 4 protein [Flavobacterium psychrotrophum]
MKIALVQDWLTEMGGAEKVFQEIYSLYPNADVYTLVYNEEVLNTMGIPVNKVTASFIQNLPFGRKKYRNYLPLFSMAIESFDLSSYDLIISSSYAVAKGVLTHSDQTHICYCHSPVRYAWDLHHQYLKEAGLQKGLKAFIVKYFLHKLRIWDVASLNRVDHFISNSDYIGRRIKKVYNRQATTIYPPIGVEDFTSNADKGDFYLTCSRMVPYKKIDLIVESFSKMPDKKLIVIGTGPDYEKIKKLAGPNIILMGYQTFAVLKDHMQRAKAFVFAAEEDFGIVPLEAQAAGTPVIAYGKGGALETVIDGVTGVLFDKQNTDSIIKAVEKFETIENTFVRTNLEKNAARFNLDVFKQKFKSFVSDVTEKKQ